MKIYIRDQRNRCEKFASNPSLEKLLSIENKVKNSQKNDQNWTKFLIYRTYRELIKEYLPQKR